MGLTIVLVMFSWGMTRGEVLRYAVAFALRRAQARVRPQGGLPNEDDENLPPGLDGGAQPRLPDPGPGTAGALQGRCRRRPPRRRGCDTTRTGADKRMRAGQAYARLEAMGPDRSLIRQSIV
jgi:hypothetical protein